MTKRFSNKNKRNVWFQEMIMTPPEVKKETAM